MMSSEEKRELRSTVWNNASLSRVKGMMEAFLEGKSNCTPKWIHGQITKAHNLDEARIVLAAFGDELMNINQQKFAELRNILAI